MKEGTMRNSTRLSRTTFAVLLCGLVATCGDPKTNSPVAPTAPFLTEFQIIGPDTVAPVRVAVSTISLAAVSMADES